MRNCTFFLLQMRSKRWAADRASVEMSGAMERTIGKWITMKRRYFLRYFYFKCTGCTLKMFYIYYLFIQGVFDTWLHYVTKIVTLCLSICYSCIFEFFVKFKGHVYECTCGLKFKVFKRFKFFEKFDMCMVNNCIFFKLEKIQNCGFYCFIGQMLH